MRRARGPRPTAVSGRAPVEARPARARAPLRRAVPAPTDGPRASAASRCRRRSTAARARPRARRRPTPPPAVRAVPARTRATSPGGTATERPGRPRDPTRMDARPGWTTTSTTAARAARCARARSPERTRLERRLPAGAANATTSATCRSFMTAGTAVEAAATTPPTRTRTAARPTSRRCTTAAVTASVRSPSPTRTPSVPWMPAPVSTCAVSSATEASIPIPAVRPRFASR